MTETSKNFVMTESDSIRAMIEKRERENMIKTKSMITIAINKQHEENFIVKGLVGKDEKHSTVGRVL